MKRRTNISITAGIYEKAQELMQQDDFDDFSGFLEHLIRNEWARRGLVPGPIGPYPERRAQAAIVDDGRKNKPPKIKVPRRGTQNEKENIT